MNIYLSLLAPLFDMIMVSLYYDISTTVLLVVLVELVVVVVVVVVVVGGFLICAFPS